MLRRPDQVSATIVHESYADYRQEKSPWNMSFLLLRDAFISHEDVMEHHD